MHRLGKTEALGRSDGIDVGVGVGTPETVKLVVPTSCIGSFKHLLGVVGEHTFRIHCPGYFCPRAESSKLSCPVRVFGLEAFGSALTRE